MKTAAVAHAKLPPTLGRYELLRNLCSGGMASIHLARTVGCRGFEKLVVIKRIRPEFAAQTEYVRMFLDEARIAARLHHANIAQVFDMGVVDGEYFLAMEFLHGRDLRQLLRARVRAGAGPLPLPAALAITIAVASGLHYAHELGSLDGEPLEIVHRDVSPPNIYVSFDGGVKLLDFGIAKAARRATQTKDYALKGKVSYMSPEQCQSRPLDRRSDLFALGVILWELTTLRRLYKGGSEFETMRRIVEEDAPPPSRLVPDYPVELERIVMKALARDPAARYPTAEALQIDLEAFARAERLAVSALTLAELMRTTFGRPTDPLAEDTLAPDDATPSLAIVARPPPTLELELPRPHTVTELPPLERDRSAVRVVVAVALALGLLISLAIAHGSRAARPKATTAASVAAHRTSPDPRRALATTQPRAAVAAPAPVVAAPAPVVAAPAPVVAAPAPAPAAAPAKRPVQPRRPKRDGWTLDSFALP